MQIRRRITNTRCMHNIFEHLELCKCTFNARQKLKGLKLFIYSNVEIKNNFFNFESQFLKDNCMIFFTSLK